MIALKNKPNVQAPDSDYPYGDIKDDTGANDGTPVDRQVYGDFHQFFEKLMHEAKLTANGLPDNDYNGFQLFDALKAIFERTKLMPSVGALPSLGGISTSLQLPITNTTALAAGTYRVMVEINITNSAASFSGTPRLRKSNNTVDLAGSSRVVSLPASESGSIVLLWEGAVPDTDYIGFYMGITGTITLNGGAAIVHKIG